jgi:hypothetical protein
VRNFFCLSKFEHNPPFEPTALRRNTDHGVWQ